MPVITVAQREAYESAEISVSADSGCQLYYTIDGSEPTAENTAINSNTLHLEPTGQDETILLKVIATKGDKKSEAASTTLPFRRERQVTLQVSREAARYDNDDNVLVAVNADGFQQPLQGLIAQRVKAQFLADGAQQALAPLRADIGVFFQVILPLVALQFLNGAPGQQIHVGIAAGEVAGG